eukprot:5729902-Amphidinium_carterae.1
MQSCEMFVYTLAFLDFCVGFAKDSSHCEQDLRDPLLKAALCPSIGRHHVSRLAHSSHPFPLTRQAG